MNAASSLFSAIIIGSRVTNHSGTGDVGVQASSDMVVTGWNYYENNTGANIQGQAAACYQFIPAVGLGTTSDIEDQSNTDQGYNVLTDGSQDFNLVNTKAVGSHFRTAIPIPIT